MEPSWQMLAQQWLGAAAPGGMARPAITTPGINPNAPDPMTPPQQQSPTMQQQPTPPPQDPQSWSERFRRGLLGPQGDQVSPEMQRAAMAQGLLTAAMALGNKGGFRGNYGTAMIQGILGAQQGVSMGLERAKQARFEKYIDEQIAKETDPERRLRLEAMRDMNKWIDPQTVRAPTPLQSKYETSDDGTMRRAIVFDPATGESRPAPGAHWQKIPREGRGDGELTEAQRRENANIESERDQIIYQNDPRELKRYLQDNPNAERHARSHLYNESQEHYEARMELLNNKMRRIQPLVESDAPDPAAAPAGNTSSFGDWFKGIMGSGAAAAPPSAVDPLPNVVAPYSAQGRGMLKKDLLKRYRP